MSTFNLQEGIKGDERREPAPNSLILSIPWKPLVKLFHPALYKEEPSFYHIPLSKSLVNPLYRKLPDSAHIPGTFVSSAYLSSCDT